MESNQRVAAGARYRDVQVSVFGQPQPVWIAEHVYVAVGIEHARLVSAANSGERKKVSSSVLRDRRRFERVDG